ncbi:hypothetical protein QJQ45_014808 [Haematococcus lacustris]|nr:hypothetical protein QJQ45_014808 [Haematococcus lacustris]
MFQNIDASLPGQVKLTPAEQSEFDNVGAQDIAAETNVGKLKKMEMYYREGGFTPTAEACRRRLMELGQPDACDPQRQRDMDVELAAARGSLKQWVAEAKQQEQELGASRSQPVPSSSAGDGSSINASYPPIRPPSTISIAPVSSTPHTAAPVRAASNKQGGGKGSSAAGQGHALAACGNGKAVKQDSKFGGQVRSGSDYYQKWDKFAQTAAAEEDQGDSSSSRSQTAGQQGSQPNPAAAAARVPGTQGARPQGLSSTAGASGAELTRLRIQANLSSLSPSELQLMAEQEKSKGNEAFRWGEG